MMSEATRREAGAARSPERARVLVLFPDDWAPFSPTVVRLAAHLAPDFDVAVRCLDTGRFDHSNLDPTVFRPVRLPGWLAMLLRKTGLMLPARGLLLALSSRHLARSSQHVIAVDGAGAAAAALLGRPFHFLSLEIKRWSPARWLVPRLARSISIQSQPRLRFQFPGLDEDRLPVVMLQNAPPFNADASRAATRRPPDPARPRLIYLGNLIPAHGLRPMLEMIRAWPEASLVLRGPAPEATRSWLASTCGDLLQGGRLTLDTSYLNDDELGSYLSSFDIGLCLYDLSGSLRHDFNYLSAPSGKMFNYFAAGLPVLGSGIEGLSPVEQHGAGRLVDDNQALSLVDAGRQIMAGHADYQAGALRAAEAFDFHASATKLVSVMLEDPQA